MFNWAQLSSYSQFGINLQFALGFAAAVAMCRGFGLNTKLKQYCTSAMKLFFFRSFFFPPFFTIFWFEQFE